MATGGKHPGNTASANVPVPSPRDVCVSQLFEQFEESLKDMSRLPAFLAWFGHSLEKITAEIRQKPLPEREWILGRIRVGMNVTATLMNREPALRYKLQKCLHCLNAILVACSGDLAPAEVEQLKISPSPQEEDAEPGKEHSKKVSLQDLKRSSTNGSMLQDFYTRLERVYWNPLRLQEVLPQLREDKERLKEEIAGLGQDTRKEMKGVVEECREVVQENVEAALFEEHPGLLAECREFHDILSDILSENAADTSQNLLWTYPNISTTKDFLTRLDIVYWNPKNLKNFLVWLESSSGLVLEEMKDKPEEHRESLRKEMTERKEVIHENIKSGVFEDVSFEDFHRVSDIFKSMIDALLPW